MADYLVLFSLVTKFLQALHKQTQRHTEMYTRGAEIVCLYGKLTGAVWDSRRFIALLPAHRLVATGIYFEGIPQGY